MRWDRPLLALGGSKEVVLFFGSGLYSGSTAQIIAPLLAAPFLLLGMSGGGKNYGLLIVIAAVLTASTSTPCGGHNHRP